MCGIVGYVGNKQVVPLIIDGLRKLEYRGYDSAGIAVVDEKRNLRIERAEGKLRNLEDALRQHPIDGTYGVGHTRWATHGRPTEENAHPHRDCTGRVVVVHNGIIENYLDLKEDLRKKDHQFVTETDTEVIAHLVEEHLKQGETFEGAVRKTVQQLRGIFALSMLSADEPDTIISARFGPPAVIGIGNQEFFVASDVPAILEHTRDVFFLGDSEIAVMTKDGVRVTDFHGNPVEPQRQRITWDPIQAEKGGFKHFMLKELYEQPHAGPEIGVASTKAFTAQMIALYLFGLYLGQTRGTLTAEQSRAHTQELAELPVKMEHVLSDTEGIEELAKEFFRATDFLYLGRGINFPIALEGALKLKELSYVHAEGYPAGEMKHGPNALIDERLPVLFINTREEGNRSSELRYEKTHSNIVEVKAREGIVISVVTEGDSMSSKMSDRVIEIPPSSDLLSPLLSVIPLQLLAYHIAVRRGCDVDQPRNLAKSVTVE